MSALHMPSLASPISGRDPLTPVWAKYLREIHEFMQAELSPGRIAPFYLSATDLVDADQFVQAGATAGLGVGIRRGWALCNGNNGTPVVNDTFLRWSTSAAGTTGGSDSSAHTHPVDVASTTTSSTAITVNQMPKHSHSKTWAVSTSDGTGNSYYELNNTSAGNVTWSTDETGGDQGHTHTVDPASVTSGSASSTDNRPAFKTMVPLMRL